MSAVGRTPGEQVADVTITEASPSVRRMLADTWRQRRLFPWFAARMVTKLYATTRLGRAWVVLRPGLTIIGGTLLFGTILKLETGVPYLVFLAVGMAGWTAFDRTAFWAMRGLERWARLWLNFNFPMPSVAIGAAAFAYVEVAVYGLLGLGALVFYWIADGQLYLNLGPELLLGLAGLLLASAFGIGLGMILSLLNMKGRDTMYLFRFALQIWMYLTPVLYPASELPEGLRFLATINPVAPMVDLVKYGFLGETVAQVQPAALLVSLVVTAVVVGAALFLYARRAHWIFRDVRTYDPAEDEGVTS
jgi:lipopolysaccharide transport system permease protein